MRISNDFLTPAQRKKLKELGDYLHEVRVYRGLSVAHVAERTNIQERLILAIESADTTHLPEPIYIQALIRRIGDAIGIDGRTLASAFPTQPNLRGIKPSWKPIPKPFLRPVHIYLIYIVGIMTVVSGTSSLLRSPETQLAQNEAQSETADQSSQPNSPVATNAVATPVSQPPIDEGKVTVTMKLEEESWLKVVADGSVAFEGTLAKGEERTWEAEDKLTVMAGNAGGVVVTINNDSEAKPLGAPGSVETVTYQPPGDKKKPS